jgi:hypothetical protein
MRRRAVLISGFMFGAALAAGRRRVKGTMVRKRRFKGWLSHHLTVRSVWM